MHGRACSRPSATRCGCGSSPTSPHPSGGEACVCDIQDVGVSQPTVSHHLKKLREAGLLTSERRGSWVYYRVAPGVLDAMATMLVARTLRCAVSKGDGPGATEPERRPGAPTRSA